VLFCCLTIPPTPPLTPLVITLLTLSHNLSFTLPSSVYSSDEDDDDVEIYDHDYDGPHAKTGKRHLGKTRWTREEVCKTVICLCLGVIF